MYYIGSGAEEEQYEKEQSEEEQFDTARPKRKASQVDNVDEDADVHKDEGDKGLEGDKDDGEGVSEEVRLSKKNLNQKNREVADGHKTKQTKAKPVKRSKTVPVKKPFATVYKGLLLLHVLLLLLQ